MMKRLSQISIAPAWMLMASMLLSLGWILPNHSRPWSSFHSDAWVAAVLSLVGLVVIIRTRKLVFSTGLIWMLALLAMVPFLQYAFGLLNFVGQAWIVSAYLIGFLLAFLVGQQWQGWHPVGMGDLLFLAIGMAALISVALQLQQWLGIQWDGALDVWVLNSDGVRPYANMGQPNQLATLLLWGILAFSWGVWRRQLGCWSTLFAVAFLLFGLALTQSRTGTLSLLVLVGAAWVWRGLWGKQYIHMYVTGLGIFYILVQWSLSPLSRILMIAEPVSAVSRIRQELRPLIWRLFLDAASDRPLAGYGWNQILEAQVAVSERHTAINVPFMQSHNLFLDFVLWAGIPVGLLLVICVLSWLGVVFRRVDRPQHILYFLMILVVGTHAMLEYPLHYAYLLLPTGLVVGALNAELKIWQYGQFSMRIGSWILFSIWCFATVLLLLIVRDYFRVEAAYVALQMENAHIENSQSVQAPDVILLTDLREIQRFMKFEPVVGISRAELEWARNIVKISPSSQNFMALAVLLGLNNRSEEAKSWLIKMCLIIPQDQCASAPVRWELQQKLHPPLEAIIWPGK